MTYLSVMYPEQALYGSSLINLYFKWLQDILACRLNFGEGLCPTRPSIGNWRRYLITSVSHEPRVQLRNSWWRFGWASLHTRVFTMSNAPDWEAGPETGSRRVEMSLSFICLITWYELRLVTPSDSLTRVSLNHLTPATAILSFNAWRSDICNLQ